MISLNRGINFCLSSIKSLFVFLLLSLFFFGLFPHPFLLLALLLPEAFVVSVRDFEQLIMGALFYDLSIFKYDDFVAVSNC